MNYKLVYIEWEDSLKSDGSWVWSDGEWENEDEMKHITVGFLIKRTKRALYISQSRKFKSETDGSTSISQPFVIPVRAILKVKRLK